MDDEAKIPIVFAISLTCFGLALITTILRLCTRLRLLRGLQLDDYLIFLSTLLAIIGLPFFISFVKTIQELQVQFQALKNLPPPPAGALPLGPPPGAPPGSPPGFPPGSPPGFPPGSPSVPPPAGIQRPPGGAAFQDNQSTALKNTFLHTVFYLAAFGVLKVSLLALYLQFLPKGRFRSGTYVTAVVVILFTIGTVLATLFQCQPISAAWDPEQGVCSVNAAALHFITGIFHIVTDLVILLMPLGIVMKLQMTFRKKLGVLFVFAMGIVVTIATMIRVAIFVRLFRLQITMGIVNQVEFLAKVVRIALDGLFWAEIEIHLGIICANLPALAMLWKALRGRVKSSYAKYGRSGSARAGSNSYALGSRTKSSANAVRFGVKGTGTFSTSEERIMSKDDGILKSTEVTMDVERIEC